MRDDRRRGAICGTHETYTVVSALRCPVCRLEKAERELEEARKAHRAAITRQNDAEWQARGIAERLGWDGQGNAVGWLGSQIDAARAAAKEAE